MSALTNWFNWNATVIDDELPDLFPLGIVLNVFTETDVVNIYQKILIDVIERTQGIPENLQPLIWDNCVQSESSEGLVTLLTEAMLKKSDLFLVYNSSLGTIRRATYQETAQIRADYEKSGHSKAGIFISFKNYHKTDMLVLYSGLEYCLIAAMNKTINLSKAVQFKMSEMRKGVSLNDSAEVKTQATDIAKALSRGKDVMMDAADSIETANPEVAAIREAILFLDSKRSFYLGLPLSYITGEQTAGIGSTGEADTKAVERGLKLYYFSIIKPTLETIFGIKTSFKSQDFRQIGSALEALKTFELVSDDFLSRENKLTLLSKLFDVDIDVKAQLKQLEESIEPTVEEASGNPIRPE